MVKPIAFPQANNFTGTKEQLYLLAYDLGCDRGFFKGKSNGIKQGFKSARDYFNQLPWYKRLIKAILKNA